MAEKQLDMNEMRCVYTLYVHVYGVSVQYIASVSDGVRGLIVMYVTMDTFPSRPCPVDKAN